MGIIHKIKEKFSHHKKPADKKAAQLAVQEMLEEDEETQGKWLEWLKKHAGEGKKWAMGIIHKIEAKLKAAKAAHKKWLNLIYSKDAWLKSWLLL